MSADQSDSGRRKERFASGTKDLLKLKIEVPRYSIGVVRSREQRYMKRKKGRRG